MKKRHRSNCGISLQVFTKGFTALKKAKKNRTYNRSHFELVTWSLPQYSLSKGQFWPGEATATTTAVTSTSAGARRSRRETDKPPPKLHPDE